MSILNEAPLSQKRLQTVFKQLANDRKLDTLTYAAENDQFSVAMSRSRLRYAGQFCSKRSELDHLRTEMQDYSRRATARASGSRSVTKPLPA